MKIIELLPLLEYLFTSKQHVGLYGNEFWGKKENLV